MKCLKVRGIPYRAPRQRRPNPVLLWVAAPPMTVAQKGIVFCLYVLVILPQVKESKTLPLSQIVRASLCGIVGQAYEIEKMMKGSRESTVTSPQTRAFCRCYALRRVFAPGCKDYGTQVFAECCSLLQVGIRNDTPPNQLAPQAELRPGAFSNAQHCDNLVQSCRCLTPTARCGSCRSAAFWKLA